MDTPSLIKACSEAIGGGGMSPNEARRRFLGLGKVKGGDTPYLQQQNYSLAALDKRDSKSDPFASNTPAPPAPGTATPPMLTPPAKEMPPAELRLACLVALEQKGAES
jgi:hypothetical protein